MRGGCVHGDKPWRRVSALVRVRASVDGVVGEVRRAVLEEVQDAFADFFFAFVSVEDGLVEAQVERNAPCVSAKVVAFGEPGHGLWCAVVFGVISAKTGDRVGRLLQKFNACLCDFKPGFIACCFGEHAVECHCVVAWVGKVVAENGGELDELAFRIDNRAYKFVLRFVLDIMDELLGIVEEVFAVESLCGDKEGGGKVFFAIRSSSWVHHGKVGRVDLP